MTGFLITCINDMKLLLIGFTPAKEAVNENLPGNSGLLLTLVQPAIEYIVRCLFKDLKQVSQIVALVLLLCWSIGMFESNKLMLGCALLHKSYST